MSVGIRSDRPESGNTSLGGRRCRTILPTGRVRSPVDSRQAAVEAPFERGCSAGWLGLRLVGRRRVPDSLQPPRGAPLPPLSRGRRVGPRTGPVKDTTRRGGVVTRPPERPSKEIAPGHPEPGARRTRSRGPSQSHGRVSHSPRPRHPDVDGGSSCLCGNGSRNSAWRRPRPRPPHGVGGTLALSERHLWAGGTLTCMSLIDGLWVRMRALARAAAKAVQRLSR